MKRLFKLIAILIVIILIGSAAYAVFTIDTDESGKDGDNIAPIIGSITGDTDGSTGKITSIVVSFSDNVEVTVATIYFKSANDDEWKSESILLGNYDITIPSDSDDDWYYYVTIDDAAGNGPVGKPSTDGSIYFVITVTETVEELVHTVFIEEAAGEACPNCPGVSELMHKLYDSGEYNFEYVSLVYDKDHKDKQPTKRLLEDYNQIGLPTLYIDGGFKVNVGGAKTLEELDQSKFINDIEAAEQRSVPEIQVTVDVIYENDSDKFTTNVIVKNFNEEKYTGSLKVYLAEIISTRHKIEGKYQVYHDFIDFIMDIKNISVNGGEEIQESKDWDLNGLDPENLIIMAAVFSSKSEKRESFPNNPVPGGSKYPFDAYFADASDGIRLIEGGNLPPKVGIVNPEKGMVHFFGRPLFKSPLSFIGRKITWLFFKTNIVVEASDDDGEIEKVEFYIDGDLIFTDEEAPYEKEVKRLGLLKSLFFKKHTIKVIAYDDSGKTSFAELEVKVRW